MDEIVLLKLLPTYLFRKSKIGMCYILLLIVCAGCQSRTEDGIKNTILDRFDQHHERAAPYRMGPKNVFQNCLCGQINVPKQREARIINGNEVNPPYKYPWMAVLKKNGRFICAGSLINDRYILTAAHCVVERVYRLYEVVVGVHNIENIRNSNPESVPGEPFIQKSQVERIKFFESNGYDREMIWNDIALVKLRTPVAFNNQVSPVCLPLFRGWYSGPTRDGIITGWGTTERGFVSNVPNEAAVKVNSAKICDQITLNPEKLNRYDLLCTAGPGKDYCKGDAGGPLITKSNTSYAQIGVTSWKFICDQDKFPGLFTLVARFVREIYIKTRGGIYCRNPDARI